MTTGAALFCELGDMLGLVDLVALGDAMVRAALLIHVRVRVR